MNRSVLCICGIEAENNFLLEFLATYHDADTNLIMYFTVKTTFINYTDQFNPTEEHFQNVRLDFLHNRTDILSWRPTFTWHQARLSQV